VLFQMCRFFSGPLFTHAALAQYEFVWRLDTDSFLLGPPMEDPFEQMVSSNATYAWIHAYRDEPVFVTGLWEATASFLDAMGIGQARIHAWMPEGDTWVAKPMCFATNCFIARVAWFASAPYMDYFNALDASGGFYTHRWGDACVHMLAVAALLPLEATLRLTTVAYWHQGTVILPSEQRVAAHELLGGKAAPPFAIPSSNVTLS